MNTILKMTFGSQVYGTSLPTSDTDYKAIYIPSAKDILMGRVKETLSTTTKKDPKGKNSSEDVDIETFSLKQYMKLLLEGQTVALDMLFSGYDHIVENDWNEYRDVWGIIQENRHRFISKQCTSFVGYAKQQAAKYGIKGSRIAAVRKAIELLHELLKFEGILAYSRLSDCFITIDHFVNETWKDEHIRIVNLPNPKGTLEPYLEVCNRKIAFHATIKYALDILQKIFDEYGLRALQAEKDMGVDRKACMHAVRVTHQAIELFNTGCITFPRPEKDLLLAIRKGEMPYKEVATLIESKMEEMLKAAEASHLPEKPDVEFAEELVYTVYNNEICSSDSGYIKGLFDG